MLSMDVGQYSLQQSQAETLAEVVVVVEEVEVLRTRQVQEYGCSGEKAGQEDRSEKCRARGDSKFLERLEDQARQPSECLRRHVRRS